MKLAVHTDLKAAEGLIRASIARYGFAPEHTYEYFLHSAEEGWEAAYLEIAEGWGVMAYRVPKDKEWRLIAEPLAPAESRADTVVAFLEHAFSEKDIEAVYMELTTETRKGLLAVLPSALKARRISETMEWPILELKAYNPSLPGATMKPMRNVTNRFMREHAFESVDAASADRPALHRIVDLWKKNRTAGHRAYAAEYHALIDDAFKGTEGARAYMVDGVPEALSAGWRIPNSDTYYNAVMLHTYLHWGLGEFTMLKALEEMKQAGYAEANLGGSDASLFAFKKKFGTVRSYETHYFSVARRS